MEKKNILIFAHYYHPDVASTGQLLKEQAEGMLTDFNVTVVCVVPSYGGVIADEYKTKKYYFENINGVNVIRVRVPEFTKTNKLSRVKNIIAYFFNALGAAMKSGKQDYIFTISQPPVLGGLLGVCAKWLKRAKLIYCIQDFNPEQIIAVNYSKNKPLLALMLWLDKFSCKRSNLVVTVGRDLVETLEKRFNNKKVPYYAMINNWIDEKAIYPLPQDNEQVQLFKQKYGLQNKFVIMYSGNLGLYYDLLNLLKVIENFKAGTTTPDGREVAFVFVGDGSVREEMVHYKQQQNLDNVYFVPYQPKSDLNYSLNAADVHWCVNSKGIKGVSCPSKFYGIAAAGKPVIGVLEEGSEIDLLINEIGCGVMAQPGDYKQVEKNIRWIIDNANSQQFLEMGVKNRKYLVKNLTRSISIEKYINAIKKC